MTPSEHPAAFQLEAQHAGETDEAVAAHVASCELCQSTLAALDGARAALMAKRAPADFARDIRALADAAEAAERRPSLWQRLWMPGIVVAAAAAAVMVFAVPGGPPVGPRDGGVRLKGAARLGVVVLRGQEQVESWDGPEVTLQAGDRVRVAIELPSTGLVTVGVLDAGGAWQVLVEGGSLRVGRHVLERSFRVAEGEALDATVLAGPPGEVAEARAGDADAHVTRLRLRATE